MAKRYSAKLKFQVVTELLSGDKSTAQVAKVYNVQVAEYERRIAELERLIGRKEVEIALLKNFLGHGR